MPSRSFHQNDRAGFHRFHVLSVCASTWHEATATQGLTLLHFGSHTSRTVPRADSATSRLESLRVFRFRTSKALAGPESASHPDSLTLPPTKCLHSPPYDHPKMDKSSTPGAGGGDQATSGEPQYIRARVQSACDGCKARKGRQLPLFPSCHWPVPPDLRLWFHSICVDGCTLSVLPVHWVVAMCARCSSVYLSHYCCLLVSCLLVFDS